jgi:two-component system cell cycle sensor histidine kinase/response regulator CckA
MREVDKLSENEGTSFMRILVVDDELVSREKLRKIMGTFGQCVVAENGTDALRVATSQNPPDLILLDIVMPEMDGYEVCKRLKVNEITSNIPVIFISAKNEDDDEAQGLGLGAVDYITKPFSPSIVKARIRTHLELNKHRNRLEELVDKRTVELKKVTKEMKAEIVEHRHTEEALRESEEKYRTILENIEDGYFEVDIAGNFTFFNDSLCEILGYSKDELMGMNNRQYTDEENAKELYQTFYTVYTTGKADKGFDWEIIRKDGTKRSVQASVSLKRDAEGEPIGFRGVVRDISEKRRLEAQFQYAQRMESIGTLAGGMAHNFNNLLMGIMGYTSLMLLETDPDHPNHKKLKNIEKQVESGSKLTSQLLGYAREGSYEVKPISLNHLVKETSDTFGTMKKEITVHQELSENLYSIEIDQGQIEQVLLNLYVNAADAMPGGGYLFLETMNVTDKAMTGKPYEVKPGNYVLVTVKDTGVGMDQETRERIFEPFFTTKGLASGTGLGMASAYGIIKGHGGYIDVDSKIGKGSAISIYLPATEREVKEEKALPDQFVKGKGTVLLVDDEEMVLETGGQMLKHLGYEVLLAGDGQEALELYKKKKDKIDLVLLDMVMPVMGGGKTFDRMKEIYSDVKVLLSSGYSIEGEAKEILERGCDAFIQKPFKLEQLSQKIGEIFDKK